SGRNEEGSAAEVPGLIAAEVRGPRKGEPMGRCHAPKNIVMVVMAILGVLVATLSSPAQPAADKLDRTVLPILAPKRPVYKQLDARNVKAPAHFEVRAPASAPNVVIVLVDDLGFGGPSTFGGPISTPTLDALAQNGLRYNNFHTTALCSPTRAALKAGR